MLYIGKQTEVSDYISIPLNPKCLNNTGGENLGKNPSSYS